MYVKNVFIQNKLNEIKEQNMLHNHTQTFSQQGEISKIELPVINSEAEEETQTRPAYEP